MSWAAQLHHTSTIGCDINYYESKNIIQKQHLLTAPEGMSHSMVNNMRLFILGWHVF